MKTTDQPISQDFQIEGEPEYKIGDRFIKE